MSGSQVTVIYTISYIIQHDYVVDILLYCVL